MAVCSRRCQTTGLPALAILPPSRPGESLTKAATSLVLIALVPLLGCDVPSSKAQGLSAEPTHPLPLSTAAVTTRGVPNTLTLTGSLRANRESSVAADATGKVIEVAIERGSHVKKGSVLLQIDRRQAALMAEEASTSVAAARTRSTLARADCERATRLFARQVINQAEYDATKAHCDDAALGVNAAAVRRELATKTLGDLMIRAPFDAVVAERFINPGEYVRPETRVASLVELDPLRLELSVPEHAAAACSPGAEVRFKVAAFAQETFVGRVQFGGRHRAARDARPLDRGCRPEP